MSGTSNVGQSSVYEAGDQRNSKDSENQADRFHEGKEHSHKANDPKDERSIANKLERETKREEESEKDDPDTELTKKDPTLLAKSHGNKPSKGAEIDKQIQEEEEAELKKKGAFGPSKSNN